MRLSLCLFGMVICLASAAMAQDSARVHLRIEGGLSAPTGGLTKAYRVGLTGAVGIGIQISDKWTAVPQIEFHALKPKNEYWLTEFRKLNPAIDSLSGGTLVVLLIGSNLRYQPGSSSKSLRPFISGGGGWANVSNADFSLMSENLVRPTGINSENKVYWNIGAGFEVGHEPAILFLFEARFVRISADPFNYNLLPITLGLRF